MLKVAIHENVQMHKVTKNDKGALVIGFKKVNGDYLADLDSASDESSSQEQDLMFMSPFATNFDKEVDTPENNSDKIKNIKNQLTHFLLGYTTQDKIKWDTTKNTGIDRSNFAEKMTQQTVINTMFNNLVDQFIEQITPHIGPNSPLFRVLFVRTNKIKHFPTVRKQFISENPFWEPMTVSKEQSKLKYTEWEKTNGYNNGEKVATADIISEAQAAAAHDVLSN